jgi:hypothetical protein
VKQLELPQDTRLSLVQNALRVILLGVLIISPLVHLRTVAHIIPSRFSDLYSPWVGTYAALHGKDPYSMEVTRQIQTWLYGKPLGPNDTYDKQAFVYPAHAILLLAPLTWVSWPLARFASTALGPLLVGFTAWIWIQICGLSISTRRTAVLLILISCSWPAIWGYRVQQPTLLVLAISSATCFLLQREYPVAAGALLAFATIKPQVVTLLILWLLVAAIIESRWRFIAAFFLSLTTLVFAAEAIVRGWISRWFAAALTYGHETSRQSLLTLIFHRQLGLIVTVLLAIWVCVILRKLTSRISDPLKYGSAAALVLAFTSCTIPTSLWMAFNPLLLIPAVLLLFGEQRRPMPPFVTLSLAAASFEVLAAPFCVLLSLFTGYRLLLAWLPFFGAFVPVVITLALALALQRDSLSTSP